MSGSCHGGDPVHTSDGSREDMDTFAFGVPYGRVKRQLALGLRGGLDTTELSLADKPAQFLHCKLTKSPEPQPPKLTKKAIASSSPDHLLSQGNRYKQWLRMLITGVTKIVW